MVDRSPIISADNPSWHYEEPVTNRIMTYTTGSMAGVLCMALFAGQDSVEPIIIPLDIMVHAIELGALKEKEQQCANNQWEHNFVPSRQDQIYCSKRCKSYQGVARHRKRTRVQQWR